MARPDNCIDCGTKLPLYRSNRMLRCSKCAEERNKNMALKYKRKKKFGKCSRCLTPDVELKTRFYCAKCWHILTYVPKPKPKPEANRCKWCGEEIPKNRVFCKGTSCRSESIAWNKEIK